MDLRRDVAREIARIYCRLSPSGIEALSEILVPFKYSKGDVVLPEGETCRHMYFVERGMVRQYYYKGGRDVTEHFSYEGRIVICIESFLKQEPSRLIVEALENSRLYGIPYDALQELADPKVCLRALGKCRRYFPSPLSGTLCGETYPYCG